MKTEIESYNYPIECDILNKGFGIVQKSYNSVIKLWGKDVLEFLDRITTNRVSALSKYNSMQTIFTNDKGRIIDSASIINLSDYQYIIGTDSNSEKLIGWINKFIISDDVFSENKTGQMSVLTLIGTFIEEFLSAFIGRKISFDKNGIVESFQYNNTECCLARSKSIMGYSVIKIISYIDVVDDLKNAFLDTQHTPYICGNLSHEFSESFRITYGMPCRNEFSDSFSPNELQLLENVDFKKGGFIGQEIIARLDTYNKVQRQKTGFLFMENIFGDDIFTLFDNSQIEIGKITSIARALKGSDWVGLGVLKKNFSNIGSMIIAKGTKSQRTYNAIVREFENIL